jgi:hypothetical protein
VGATETEPGRVGDEYASLVELWCAQTCTYGTRRRIPDRTAGSSLLESSGRPDQLSRNRART